MKVGYVLDTHFGPYRQPVPAPALTRTRLELLAEEARRADAAGFEGVYVPDRHARTECAVASPLVLLSALVPHVPRARLGVFSLVLTAYHPMLVAEEAALVDLLSAGRLTLTISMGYHEAYWRQFGIDGRQRMSRFEESIDILKLAWRGEPFSYDGRRFPLDRVLCTPPPYQPGGPPLWIGGESGKQISRAARLAEGWAAGITPLDPARWAAKVERYRTEAGELGRPSEVVLMRDAYLAEDYATAAALAGPGIVGEQLFYFQENGLQPMNRDFASAADFTIDKLRPHVVIGGPADCLEQIQRLEADFGVDTLLLRLRRPLGPEPEQVLESIDRFAADVLPHV
ncbi:MAG TPA: LLM class flavin-dependent oxidoreductase [Mycobacteriales bacterium]|jgi:alkanesulfonate monooxygenase SsuD/methylene tetrahydromethanopterin reductase-like flavin-dependent oxidoreductase (luciferase family)|nr:LLM class flavin-dependent oxidoreductase [Mycobacteriales bacterium]